MAPRQCQYINCANTEKTHTMFGFPASDKNRLRIWINNSGKINLTTLTPDELKYWHLCEDHFDQCYKNQKDQKRLTGTAMFKNPTVNSEPGRTQPSALSLTDESILEKGLPQVVTHSHSTNLATASSSGTSESNLEQCSIAYFAGWLANTCQDKFDCQRCYPTMTKDLDLTDQKQLLIIERSYGDGESTKLKCPDDYFCGIIDKCLTYYDEQFNLIKHKLN